MRRSLYASGSIHAAILVWIAVSGMLFRDGAEPEFEVTGVTILSVSEFEAITAGLQPTPVALESPPVPLLPETADAPEAPAVEETAPETVQPEQTAAPAPETNPEAEPPVPQAEVTDEAPTLLRPSGAPDLPLSPRPSPREAPRVAPLPAPAQEPEVETAPEAIDQATAPEVSETPTEEQTDAAPEEATTEIVTEAEEPAGGPLGPQASVRPTARPSRPAPVQPAAAETATQPETEIDPIAAAVAAAVAEAASAPAAPTAPSGPPLSSASREGFRVAVSACWNVGSLSSEALLTTVVVGFDMARDGRPEASTIRLIEFTGGSDSAAQQAYEAARRAVIRCGVNGYELPEDSYDRWQQVELVFNPEGMRLR